VIASLSGNTLMSVVMVQSPAEMVYPRPVAHITLWRGEGEEADAPAAIRRGQKWGNNGKIAVRPGRR